MKKILLSLLVFTSFVAAHAQTNPTIVNAPQLFKQYIVVAPYSTVNLPSSPYTGEVVFNTDSAKLGFYNGVAWTYVQAGPATSYAAGYGIKFSGSNILFDSAHVRKIDSLYAITDSTYGYYINGGFRTFKARGAVFSINGHIGAVVLNNADIVASLGYTPANANTTITINGLTQNIGVNPIFTIPTNFVDSVKRYPGNDTVWYYIGATKYFAFTDSIGGSSGGVASFNTRTGAVVLTSGDVTTALGYTPLAPSNNLSDITSASTARTNLGLAPVASTGTFGSLTSIPPLVYQDSSYSNPSWLTSLAYSKITGVPIVSSLDTGMVTPALFSTWNAKSNGLTGVTATGGTPLFSTMTGWSSSTVSLSFSLSNAGAYNFFGNPTSSSTTPIYFSAATAASILPQFTSSTQGVVPSTGGVGSTYFLNASGTWSIPAGGGGTDTADVAGYGIKITHPGGAVRTIAVDTTIKDTNYIKLYGNGLIPLRGSNDSFYVKTDSAGNGISITYSPDSALSFSATNLIDTTIAGIRALTSASSSTIYYTKDLGKQGNWYYVPTDVTSADNTGTILVSAGGQRFYRQFSGAVNVLWFGSTDDDSTDNQVPINNAKAYAIPLNMDVYFPVTNTGLYKVSSFPGTSSNVIFDLSTGISSSPYRVRFYGDKGATIITALDSNTATYPGMRLFRVNGAYNDLTFENLAFINTHPLASSANYTGCLMLTGGTNSQLIKHPIIKNCFFNGWSNDIETDGVDDIEIYGNKFISPLGHDNATNSTTPAPYIWMFCNSNGLTRNPDIHDNYAYAYTGTDITTTTTRAVFDNFVYGNPIGGKVHHNFIFNFGTEAISLSQYNSTAYVTTPTEISDNYIDNTIIKNSWNIGTSTLATSSTAIRTQSLNPVVKNNALYNVTVGIMNYVQGVINFGFDKLQIKDNIFYAADSGQGIFSKFIVVSGYGSGTVNKMPEISGNTFNLKDDSLKANATVLEIDYTDSAIVDNNKTIINNLTKQSYTLAWLTQTGAVGTYLKNNLTIPNNNSVYNGGLYVNSGGSTVVNLDSIPNFAVTEVDTIYRTAGKDSIQFTIGGRYHAILDSIGGGGNFVGRDSVLTITSGSSSTVTNGYNVILFNPATALGAYTLTLPTTWHTSNTVTIVFGGTIASGSPVVTLTIVGGSGQSVFWAVPISGTTFQSGEAVTFKLVSGNDYRIN